MGINISLKGIVTNDNYPGDVDYFEGVPLFDWLEDHVVDWGMMAITDEINKLFETQVAYGYWEPYFKVAMQLALSVLVNFARSELAKIEGAVPKTVYLYNAKYNVPGGPVGDAVTEKAWNRAMQVFDTQLREKVGK